MFFRYIDFIFAPFRAIHNKILGVKNIKGNIQIDARRAQAMGRRGKQQAANANQKMQQYAGANGQPQQGAPPVAGQPGQPQHGHPQQGYPPQPVHHGDVDRRPASIADQRAFCERHLLPWALDCCNAITQNSIAKFYRQVASYTCSFLALERDSLAIE